MNDSNKWMRRINTISESKSLTNLSAMDHIKKIISQLDLKPHPEGGYFKETYRSEGAINEDALPGAFEGKRNLSTCIYFLLTSDAFSAFHRIKQDEIWHFYTGSPLDLHIIDSNGNYSKTLIGNYLERGETPQHVVKGGDWFGARVINKNDFSLVGCTVSPGFDFADFELPERKSLVSRFPQHEKIITELTRI